MTLSVRQLSFLYEKQRPVLENLSFSAKRGEFIGIFGPNGGGKTTLLRLLLGLLKPSQGAIEILGASPSTVSHRVGYVPQMRRFDPQFPISVMEVVLQGRLSHHRKFGGFSETDRALAHSALHNVGLGDRTNFPFGKLSGGQVQRTLLARALVAEPEILLLDEATAGIDAQAVKEILDFLLALKGKMTILLVTHQLQEVARDMDRLFCINRQLTIYSPEQVCEHYALGLYHPPLVKEEKSE